MARPSPPAVPSKDRHGIDGGCWPRHGLGLAPDKTLRDGVWKRRADRGPLDEKDRTQATSRRDLSGVWHRDRPGEPVGVRELDRARAILTAAFMANETVEENPQQLDDASVWTTTPEGERVPN